MTALTQAAIARDSLFTRLDIRSKLALLISITVIAFLWDSLILQAALTGLVLLCSLMSGVRLRFIGLILKVLLPLAVILVFTHGLFNVDYVRTLAGKKELTRLFPLTLPVLGRVPITVEGTLFGLNIALKSLTLSLIMPLVLLTTDVDNLIVGLVRARVPYKLAFIFSATLRFFPLLFQDISSIIEAQRMRGLALEEMNFIRRIRVYARVAVPLVLSAMVKSQQLEVVLQAKAFSGTPARTYLHESRLHARDYALLGLSLAFSVLAVWLYVTRGVGRFAGPI